MIARWSASAAASHQPGTHSKESHRCGSVNVISTRKTTSCRRSLRESPPMRSLCRLLNRAEQKEYEDRLATISERAAKRQGRSRRDFLRSGSGMAAALVALNQVHGDCYEVAADEVDDPKAFRGALAQGSVHPGRADAPRRCREQVVRRHSGRPRNQERSS